VTYLKKIVVDTSALIQGGEILERLIKNNTLIIPSTAIDELDNQKESSDSRRAFNGRTGLRFLKAHEKEVEYVVSDIVTDLPHTYDLQNNDNRIISVALYLNASLATFDMGMKYKAISLGIECIDMGVGNYNKKDVGLLGYKTIEWDCSEKEIADKLNELAMDDTSNIFELLTNEFVILKDTSRPLFTEDGIQNDFEIQAIMQWDGNKMIPIKYKNIDNHYVGKVKPRNIQQKMLFSLMQNEDITIKLCSGGYGVGKDYCMMTNALELLSKNKYDRIVWFRNPVNVKGIAEVGFLPGDFLEKSLPYTAILDDILGENFGTEMFLKSNKLEIGNLGAVRGRTFKNSIIYLTEMQNCSTEIIQLLLSRVGEGSILVLNGDFKQIDAVQHSVSSIKETVEVLGGIGKFGWVQLDKVERSETADLARLFDMC